MTQARTKIPRFARDDSSYELWKFLAPARGRLVRLIQHAPGLQTQFPFFHAIGEREQYVVLHVGAMPTEPEIGFLRVPVRWHLAAHDNRNEGFREQARLYIFAACSCHNVGSGPS